MVNDIEAAHAGFVARGVEVSEIFHRGAGKDGRLSGPDPERRSYASFVTFNDPEWATAALYRIGDAYERFAKALRGAPVPAQLSADEQQVYRDELEKVVVVVEEKAIDAYKTGYQKALQLGVYNEFTQKLRAALGRMSDQEFPPEAEARARPAVAEPRPALPFVSAVQR